jgi:hypothetical protein
MAQYPPEQHILQFLVNLSKMAKLILLWQTAGIAALPGLNNFVLLVQVQQSEGNV